MRRTLHRTLSVLFGILIVVGGCSEQTTALELQLSGEAAFDEGLLTDELDAAPAVAVDTVVSVLRRDVPLERRIQVTRMIGRDGGLIEIPEAGLRVRFRDGSLRERTEITVTALPGRNVP